MAYNTLITEVNAEEGYALIQMNRPDSLNALCEEMMSELTQAIDRFEADDSILCIILTGSKRAFSGGADVREIQAKTFPQSYYEDFITRNWERAARARKPIIAAVGGYAIGGGCELAMMCDIILAADSARFGQPEINLGVIPGLGGTQRLVRAIGSFKAAELVLTGRQLTAEEADRAGLVSRVVPAAQLREEAQRTAETIASKPLPALYAATAALDVALESTLAEGLRFERQAFAGLFDTADQKEGMAAFREKRAPEFRHR